MLFFHGKRPLIQSFSKATLNFTVNQVSEEEIADFGVTLPPDSEIEVKIGSHGLAWLGNIVLIFGITFLMTYAQNLGYSLLSSLLGYILVGGIFWVAYRLRKSLPHMNFMLKFSGYLLAYYVTLRLHFFTPEPLLGQFGPGLAMILIVIGLQFFFAYRNKSEFLASLAIIFLVCTALFTGKTHVTLPLLVATTAIAGVLFLTREWKTLILTSLFFVYTAHLVWLLGNPILGNQLEVVSDHQNNLIYLFAYASIFSLTTLIRRKESIPDNFFISIILWNAAWFTLLVILTVLAFFEESYSGIFGIITVLCLGFSIFLQSTRARKFAPALYACFGFVAMSISVFGYFGLPSAYLLLALQSLLVVSLALWFRSRIIVIVNTILFLIILLVYMIAPHSVDNINIAFALVALASARIMNWKKERLSLRTDGIRNLYLIEAFIMVLYSLQQVVPGQYVTLSWTVAAALYLIMSILLNNIKYRWMAILTFIATALYLFIVDLASLEVGYRILAFLFLALISFAASLYYTKRIRKKSS